MSTTTAFRAFPGSTLRLTAAPGAGASPKLAGQPEGGGCQIRMRNRGTGDVAIEFGSKPAVQAVAAAAGTPGSFSLAPGAVEIMTLQDSERFVSVVLASATGTIDVEFTPGEGL